ncbi:unnamed protein product, partial [Rotaria magnacalcarata]
MWVGLGASIISTYQHPHPTPLSTIVPSDALEATSKFMNDPVKILVKKEESTLNGIRQFYVTVERE